MTKPTLPKNGNDQTVLREHLNKLAVWKVLLVHGSFETSEDDIVRRLKRVGVEIAPEFVPALYYLALNEAKRASS